MEGKPDESSLTKTIKYLATTILYGIAISIPLFTLGNNIAIIAGILFTIFSFATKKVIYFNRSALLVHLTYFLLILLGLIYSEQLEAGMKMVERNLSFLIFPIIIPFLIQYITSNTAINNVYILFSYSALATAIVNQFSIYFYQADLIHHSYIAMYLNIAIVFFFQKIYYGKQKSLYIILILANAILIVASGSKAQIFILLLTSNTLIIILLLKRFKLKYTVAIFLLYNLCLVLVAYNLPYTKKRLLKFATTSDFIRKRNWQTNLEVIEENLWIGVGTGDALTELNKKRNPKWLEYKFKYNSHNQYLEVLLTYGFVGLLIFIILLASQTIISVKAENYVFMLILLIFLLSMLTESVLNRQKGIVLYSFLSTIFIITETKTTKVNLKRLRKRT